MKIAILGAGISGLALARRLVDGGHPREDLVLFESAPQPGGLCRSKSVEDFTYDVAGGHILFSKDAETAGWIRGCAGGEEAFVRRQRNTKIRFGDRFVHYPFENGLGDLPPEVNFECLSGYVRAWHERKLGGTAAPEDFASWIGWRFGGGIAEHFMVPYNEKIWKQPLGQLSSDWVAGRVPDAPVDDVLRASIGIRTEGYVHQSVFHYPAAGGFQPITDGIASSLLDRLRTSTPVTEVIRAGEGWRVNGEDFDLVVSTLPLNLLPDVLDGVPREVAEAMRGMEYNSVVCLLLALSRPEHPDLSWVYLPHPEQGPANRLTYLSNYSPGNAPEGRTSFLCEVTARGGAPLPGGELEEEIVAGLSSAGLLERSELLFTDRSEARFAYIVFDRGFDARRAACLSWLEAAGLRALGRFGRYEYDNADQCVMKASALARELLAQAAAG